MHFVRVRVVVLRTMCLVHWLLLLHRVWRQSVDIVVHSRGRPRPYRSGCLGLLLEAHLSLVLELLLLLLPTARRGKRGPGHRRVWGISSRRGWERGEAILLSGFRMVGVEVLAVVSRSFMRPGFVPLLIPSVIFTPPSMASSASHLSISVASVEQ